MRLSDSSILASRAFISVAGIVALGVLAGCGATKGGSSAPSAGLLAGGDANRNVVVVGEGDENATIEAYLHSGYCPPVQIRPGTESLVIYEKGHDGDPLFVRFQGSITKTARECHAAGSSLMMKVGIAGRLTAGPKGAAGSFALPLRVAVAKQHGNNLFYSEVTKVPVTITAPEYAADYATVVDNISFEVGPEDRDLIIYVGFDEGKPKPPAPTG